MSKKIELKDLASWNKLLSTERTSITRHEGVEFLMELSGLTPPGLAPPSPYATEEEIEAFECITLFDLLADDINRAESQLDIARFGDEPASDIVIDEKEKKYEQSKLIYQQALGFLRTIDDELAKGALRSPSADVYGDITMISFEELVKHFHSSSNSGKRDKAKQHRRKQLDQEEAIKSALRSHGYVLLELPKPPLGMSGPLAEIKDEMLAMKTLFNTTTLGKAWSRLLNDRKEIAYAETNHL